MNLSKLMIVIIILGAASSGVMLFISINIGIHVYFRSFIMGVLALWLVAIFLPTHFKINFVIFFAAAAISLVAIESILGLIDNPKSLESEAKKRGVDFDTRSLWRVVVDLRKEGIDATAGGRFTGIIEVDGRSIIPISGISNKTTVMCNELGPYMVYEADEHGFNNPSGLWREGPIEIAATGDSFTFGACVDPDKNAVALIREVYEGTLNLGRSGFGPLFQLASIQEYLPEIKPRRVLWFYYEGNDLANLIEEMEYNRNVDGGSWSLTNYLDIEYSQNLIANQAEIDQALAIPAEQLIEAEENRVITSGTLPGKLTLKNIRQRLANWFITRSQVSACDVTADTLLTFGRALTTANMSVNDWGGELVFVYLPAWERYSHSPLTGDPCTAVAEHSNITYHDQVITMAESMGIEVIDIKQVFDEHPDPLSLWPFRLEGHFNEDGYRLVSEVVLQSLERTK